MDQKRKNPNQNPNFNSTLDSKNRAQRNPVATPQRGFALIVALSLMPLIVASGLATLTCLWFLQVKNELLFRCEEGLLQTQSLLVESENKLLALNSPLRNLVLQKKLLKKTLTAAPNPAALAVLKARLTMIESQLRVLRRQQILLIRSGEQRATFKIEKLKDSLLKRLNQIQNQWASETLKSRIWATTPQIEMQPQKIDSSAVIYQAPVDFAKKQTLTLKWSLAGSKLFPSWINWLQGPDFAWKETCSTRPYLKTEERWDSEIGRGKY